MIHVVVDLFDWPALASNMLEPLEKSALAMQPKADNLLSCHNSAIESAIDSRRSIGPSS
jgi:hypothetical protein